MWESSKIQDLRTLGELQTHGLIGSDAEWLVTIFGSKLRTKTESLPEAVSVPDHFPKEDEVKITPKAFKPNFDLSQLARRLEG